MKKLLNNTQKKVKVYVYLAAKRCNEVNNNNVYFADVAKLWCGNKEILLGVNNILVGTRENKDEKQRVVSILGIISKIENYIDEEYENVEIEIQNVGESDFIIKWDNTNKNKLQALKTFFVCLIIFFGSSFAIMSFNEDVAVESLFQKIYLFLYNNEHEGFGVMEFMYGLGIACGIIVFFNHFGHKKITNDPTPIQVKMNQYEDDVNNLVVSEGDKRSSVDI